MYWIDRFLGGKVLAAVAGVDGLSKFFPHPFSIVDVIDDNNPIRFCSTGASRLSNPEVPFPVRHRLILVASASTDSEEKARCMFDDAVESSEENCLLENVHSDLENRCLTGFNPIQAKPLENDFQIVLLQAPKSALRMRLAHGGVLIGYQRPILKFFLGDTERPIYLPQVFRMNNFGYNDTLENAFGQKETLDNVSYHARGAYGNVEAPQSIRSEAFSSGDTELRGFPMMLSLDRVIPFPDLFKRRLDWSDSGIYRQQKIGFTSQHTAYTKPATTMMYRSRNADPGDDVETSRMRDSRSIAHRLGWDQEVRNGIAGAIGTSPELIGPRRQPASTRGNGLVLHFEQTPVLAVMNLQFCEDRFEFADQKFDDNCRGFIVDLQKLNPTETENNHR
ncbi:hypothetical protein Tco_0597162 [Tanacetum coccineum]